jgi:hypothetical protein
MSYQGKYSQIASIYHDETSSVPLLDSSDVCALLSQLPLRGALPSTHL